MENQRNFSWKVAFAVLVFIPFFVTSEETTSFEQDIALLKQTLSAAHPGYARYIDEHELEGQWAALTLKSKKKSYSNLQFYTDVSRVLASLRCEHTVADLPKDLDAQKKQHFLPFTFKLFEYRMFVERSTLSTLQKGTEISHINNVPVETILSKLMPYVSIDGYTDFTKAGKIARDFDLIGSAFEQFFAPVVLGVDKYPDSFEITLRDTKGTNIKVQSIEFSKWLTLAERPYRLDFKDAVSVKFIEPSTAVLSVDTFVNYRNPVDPDLLFLSIFKELKNKSVEKLIVDLRRNGGGSDDAQIGLMRYLYNTPFQLVDGGWLSVKPLGDLAANLTSWDRAVIDFDKTVLPLETQGYRIPLNQLGISAQTIEPAEYSFEGTVVMLTADNNASASAALMAHIQKQKHVTLVGEKTGGNQGGTTASVIAFLKLPHSQISVRVPLILNRYNIDNAENGIGATPDLFVPQTLDDWLNNKDSILEHALSMKL
ncbi:S41 family peptidase [Alteromonas oceanisediminis]|uniref:S41 family peptidase n=1 Tax=Alteromonas oceanisediminis TaxID=2836180 RepID=UPI001BDA51B5|nr:S41 family peptidase [Alteromonas oceanisediminis]MBT0587949.1 hypothetical protein [Alteromonas oceanisediminis]